MEAAPVTSCSRVHSIQITSLICCIFVISTPLIIIYLTLIDDIRKWRSEENGHHDLLTQDELLVIDTDTSLDAAVAILAVLGDPLWSGRLSAITCARRNASAEALAVNVLKILKLAGRIEIPVYMGSPVDDFQSYHVGNSDKMSSNAGDETKIKQKQRLSITDLIKLDVNVSLVRKEHAAVYLSNLVQLNTGMVSLLILGPMTNVALAMRLNPDFMLQVKQVITLGGYVKGSGQGCYHYNNIDVINSISLDPESSAFVLKGASVSDFKITILPIDTVRESFISKTWLTSNLLTVNNSLVNFISAAVSNQLGEYWNCYGLFAVAALLRPDHVISKSEDFFVDVEVSGRLTRGMMVVDSFNVTGRKPNAEIVFTLNSTAVQSILMNNLL